MSQGFAQAMDHNGVREYLGARQSLQPFMRYTFGNRKSLLNGVRKGSSGRRLAMTSSRERGVRVLGTSGHFGPFGTLKSLVQMREELIVRLLGDAGNRVGQTGLVRNADSRHRRVTVLMSVTLP